MNKARNEVSGVTEALPRQEIRAPTPWTISPLVGKYYGTYVLDADGEELFRIWNHDESYGKEGNQPSEREYAQHGSFKSKEEHDEYFYCDTHYESARDYATAKLIVEA